MIPLLLFILSSSSLLLIFRSLDKSKDALQVLLFNYLFCTIFSFTDLAVQRQTWVPVPASFSWMPLAAGLGALFLINFSLTERTVRLAGASVSSVATKVSLVMPFFFTLVIRGETPSLKAVSGLLLCFAAIVLCSGQSGKEAKTNGSFLFWLLPFSVFLGTGVTDILSQWLNQTQVPPADSDLLILLVFFAAFLSSLIYAMFRARPGSPVLQFSHAGTGLVLGLPNFISYKSLLAALTAFHHKGNVVFPIANLGVIVFTTLVSALVFREKLSRKNLIGILLALISLALFFQNE